MTNDTRGSSHWGELAMTGQAAQLSEAWLDWLDRKLPQMRRSFVVLNDVSGVPRLQAVRPSGTAIEDLAATLAAAQMSTEISTVTLQDGCLMLFPLLLAGRSTGMVGVEFSPLASTESEKAQSAELVAWGLGWLLGLLIGQAKEGKATGAHRARQLIDVLASILSEERFSSTLSVLANTLATRLGAAHVQVGWVRKNVMHVEARSHAAWHEDHSGLINFAAQAMNEALDRGSAVCWSSGESTIGRRTSAHDAYGREANAGALATVLLYDRGAVLGAVTLEREQAFSKEEIEAVEMINMIVAPVLALMCNAEAGIWTLVRHRMVRLAQRVTDASHLGLKAASMVLSIALLLSAIVPAGYRVAAPSVVEGEVQRAAVAPFQGYIREANVRAGDTVSAGQLLALLDDKDIELERSRAQAELDMAQRKERDAMAQAKRVDMRLAAAQGSQARAQLELAEEKLRRIRIVAPYDGVIVSGDLSQLLGSPVEQGKVLFEIAPLSSWRVILKVDVRDIADVQFGQPGNLMLTGFPGVSHPFSVKRVTSVALADEGRNYFRVEADLAQRPVQLRPGMKGVAKIEVGERSLLWVWTHRAIDWLRLTVWDLLP